jgi:hypothetical protein
MAAVVLVIAGSLAYFWRTYEAPLGPEYGWGSAKTLRLELTFDRASYSAGDTINLNGTITNIGQERVRLFPWDWAVEVNIVKSTKTSEGPWRYMGFLENPEYNVTLVPDTDFNRMLVVLAPNGTYNRQWSIGNGTIWSGPHGWPLQPGYNWSLNVECSYGSPRPPPALPVWTGTIKSEWQNITVIP